MRKIIKLVSFWVVLFSCGNVFAYSLDQQIEDYFSQQLAQSADNIKVNYLNQKPQLSCETPALSLMNKNRYWGKVTLVAQCGVKKSFLQLNVEATGNYIVASQPITAGTEISENNIRLQSGRLDTLPQGVILNKDQLINYVALRNINSDQPIKSTMVRKIWTVKAGQSVKVIISGEGYQIETNGKPLTNASLGDNINVRINSGKVIDGMVTPQGIIIFDKNN